MQINRSRGQRLMSENSSMRNAAPQALAMWLCAAGQQVYGSCQVWLYYSPLALLAIGMNTKAMKNGGMPEAREMSVTLPTRGSDDPRNSGEGGKWEDGQADRVFTATEMKMLTAMTTMRRRLERRRRRKRTACMCVCRRSLCQGVCNITCPLHHKPQAATIQPVLPPHRCFPLTRASPSLEHKAVT